MSLPQPEHQSNGTPHTDHVRRRSLRIVRPAPEPDKPAARKTDPRISRQLNWDQIEYFIAHDGDKFGEEDYWRDVEFDMAIEREPEIE